MATENIIYILIGLNVVYTLILMVMLIKMSVPKRELGRRENELMDEAQQRSYEMLSGATKQANALITEAELAGLRLFADEKLEGKKAASTFKQELELLEERLQGRLDESTKAAEASYSLFIKGLESTMEAQSKKAQEHMDQQGTALMDRTQEAFTVLANSMHEKIQTELDREIAQTKEIMEHYREQKMKSIDDNIFTVLTETTRIILGKSMSFKEQTELVYKALDEAKKENFFK